MTTVKPHTPDIYDAQAKARLTDPTQSKPTERVDTLRAMRRDPLVLEGAFLEMIQTMYSYKENLLHHTQPWDPKGKTKGSPTILVDSDWSDDKNNAYPMIIIDIGDMQYSTQGVEGIGAMVGYDLVEGAEHHARVVTGVVMFNHIGKSKAQALAYQATTLDIVDSFSNMIRDDLCFEKFGVTDILKPRQRKDQALEWSAGIRAQFRLQEYFSNKLESPKLKQMSVKLRSGITQRFKMVE